MQFRTTTGGTTTLELDPHERQQLDAAGGGGLAALKFFEQKQRENPLANFDEVLAIAFPQKPQAGIAPKRQPKAADPLATTAVLIDRIETAMRSSGSMQLSGPLYTALAVLNQTQVLAIRLDDMAARLNEIYEQLEAMNREPEADES